MTWAWVARNVSSELKTSTKKAGSRSATVRSSRTAKSRHPGRRRDDVDGAAGSGVGSGRGSAGTAVRSRSTTGAGLDIRTFWPVRVSAADRARVRRRGRATGAAPGSGGGERVVEVLGAAAGPLQLARRRLREGAGPDEDHLERRHADRVADPVDDGVVEPLGIVELGLGDDDDSFFAPPPRRAERDHVAVADPVDAGGGPLDLLGEHVAAADDDHVLDAAAD